MMLALLLLGCAAAARAAHPLVQEMHARVEKSYPLSGADNEPDYVRAMRAYKHFFVKSIQSNALRMKGLSVEDGLAPTIDETGLHHRMKNATADVLHSFHKYLGAAKQQSSVHSPADAGSIPNRVPTYQFRDGAHYINLFGEPVAAPSDATGAQEPAAAKDTKKDMERIARKLGYTIPPVKFPDQGCKEVPMGMIYIDSNNGISDRVYLPGLTKAQLKTAWLLSLRDTYDKASPPLLDKLTCTCDEKGIQAATQKGPQVSNPTISLGHLDMRGRWCECKEGASKDFELGGSYVNPVLGTNTKTPVIGNTARRGYSYVGYQCNSYPALASGSTCSLRSDEDVWPKEVLCEYNVVLAPGVAIIFSAKLNIGTGLTGKEDDLVADFAVGVRTSPIPRAVFFDKGYSITDASGKNVFAANPPMYQNGDLAAAIVYWLGEEFQKSDVGFDVASMLAGPEFKGMLQLFPLMLKFPNTNDGSGGSKLMSILRVKLIESASTVSVDSVSNFDMQSSKEGVCLGNLWKILDIEGEFKTALQFLSLSMDLSGSDFCIKMPEIKRVGRNLQFGLVLKGYALDKTKVNVLGFTEMLPEAWNTVPKALGAKGIKELMTAAMQYKPMSCIACQTYYSAYKDWSMESKVKELITAAFPDKRLEFEMDIGEKIGKANSGLVTGTKNNILVIKNMFSEDCTAAAGARRRLHPQNKDPLVLPLRPGLLYDLLPEAHRRQLADADISIAFPKLGTLIEDGSKLEITYNGFPKSIRFMLKLKIKAKDDIFFTAKVAARLIFGYDIDGQGMVIALEFGVAGELNIPMEKFLAATDSAGKLGSDAIKKIIDTLNAIDLGGFLDPAFAGTIQLFNPKFSFPPEFNVKEFNGLYTLSRLALPDLETKGVCLDNILEIVPVSAKPKVNKVVKLLKKLLEPIGGGLCIKFPGITAQDFFQTRIDVCPSFFNKDNLNVWPAVSMLSKATAEPSIISVVESIDKCCKPAVDGPEAALNKVISVAMPPRVEFCIPVAGLAAAAIVRDGAPYLKKGTKLLMSKASNLIPQDAAAGAASGAQKVAEQVFKVLKPDGTLNLGSVLPSCRPGSKGIGKPSGFLNACVSAAALECSKICGQCMTAKADAKDSKGRSCRGGFCLQCVQYTGCYCLSNTGKECDRRCRQCLFGGDTDADGNACSGCTVPCGFILTCPKVDAKTTQAPAKQTTKQTDNKKTTKAGGPTGGKQTTNAGGKQTTKQTTNAGGKQTTNAGGKQTTKQTTNAGGKQTGNKKPTKAGGPAGGNQIITSSSDSGISVDAKEAEQSGVEPGVVVAIVVILILVALGGGVSVVVWMLIKKKAISKNEKSASRATTSVTLPEE